MSTFYTRVSHFTIDSLYTVINTWPMQPPLVRSILVRRAYNLQEFDTEHDKDHSIYFLKTGFFFLCRCYGKILLCAFFFFIDEMVKYCYALFFLYRCYGKILLCAHVYFETKYLSNKLCSKRTSDHYV